MSHLTNYQKAALAYNKHISLTANAGSGKTTVLSKRFVEILLNENISLNNIVAITFTEKAASELYSKIAGELESRISSTPKNQLYKLEAIRRSLISAKISTIHSFCIDILKDYAPEAGIDANFSPIDSRTADELLDQCFNEIITSNILSDLSDVKHLIRIFGNKYQLVKNTKLLFNKRKITEKLNSKLYAKETNEIQSWIQTRFKSYLENLFENKIRTLHSNLTILNKVAEEYKTSETQIEINRLLNELITDNDLLDKVIVINEIKGILLTQKGEVRKRSYLSTDQYDEYSSLIYEINFLFSEFSDIEIEKDFYDLNESLAVFGKRITRFYEEVNQKYVFKKQQKSYLDFEDLLLLTQNLLTNKEVRDSLSEKYKYIMIDEYQDTNETQYNIFMPILKNLASGNLFVVGDEKQSIYMFREAEVELFKQTKNEIESQENETSILELPHSFRLAPNIALFTNILFRKLFSNPNTNFNEVEYSDLICAYQKKYSGSIDILVADEDEILESELVAKKILTIVQESGEKYNYEDITILCSRRKSFVELEKVFSEFGIPYSIVGGKGFFQQQFVYDIFNYLSFLINFENDLALASILRGPFFSLSDVELTEITLLEGDYLFAKLNTLKKYEHIIEQLNSHIIAAKSCRSNEIIRKILTENGYWSFVADKPNGDQEIANIEKLIQKSILLEDQGFNSLFDFTIYLREAINNLEDEGQAEIEDSGNAVKIMTIHQSKGLEFKVVILYKANQKINDEKLKSKEISIDKNFGILAKLPSGNNYFEDYKQAPIIGIYNYLQKKKANAELKRLLYVAITRAEERLIISCGFKKNKFWQGSFASMIFEALEISSDDTVKELNDELTFMINKDGEYVLSKLSKSINIEIQHDLLLENNIVPSISEDYFSGFNVNVDEIKSSEKNEIISASKISLFLNCPRKYELTYEYGYGELTKLFSNNSDFEFNEKEEENVPANILGSILHSLLEKNISKNDIKSKTQKLINQEEGNLLLSENQKNILLNEVFEIIENYYISKSYKTIKECNQSLNEAEFYKRENNYYLYGIIDKLILLDDRVIIVDYKSDRIPNKNIEEKSSTYLNQLLFYAYIILSNYPKIKQFELMLVFLRDDNFSITKIVERQKVKDFGKVIESSINKIRAKDFNEFKSGCKDMKYYLLPECNKKN